MNFVKKILRKRGYVPVNTIQKVYLRGYSAAQNTRLTGDWNISAGVSADSEIYRAIATVRSRARDLCNNNDYAKKYIQLCQSNVVGPDGFVFQNKAKDASGKLDKYANRLIEDKFFEWGNKKYCTVTGSIPFRDVQELVIKTVARDGEIFIRKVRGPNINKFGFALQIIEPDFIDERYNVNLENGNVIRMGVELNQYRCPVAYHVKKIKPETELYSSLAFAAEHERVLAEDMYHIYDRTRANQTRGMSWMAASMFRLHQLTKYEEYALINARISASKMGFFKRDLGDGEYTGDEKDEEGNLVINADPGSFEELPAGMDFVPFDPKFPSDQHEAFVKSILRGIASGLGVSYNTLANDLEGVNYSSIRSGLLDERDNWKRTQAWFIDSFLTDLFTDWLSVALLTQVNLPTHKFDKFNQPSWMGRRWQWVDPSKDVKANREAVKAGFKTNAQIIAEQGFDIYEVYEQLQLEQDLQKEYGLKLGEIKDGQGTANNAAAAQDEADDSNKGNNKRRKPNG